MQRSCCSALESRRHTSTAACRVSRRRPSSSKRHISFAWVKNMIGLLLGEEDEEFRGVSKFFCLFLLSISIDIVVRAASLKFTQECMLMLHNGIIHKKTRKKKK